MGCHGARTRRGRAAAHPAQGRHPGGEPHFEIEHDHFFLYPTFDHQQGRHIRESHRPELGRALEEGVWADGEPPASVFTRDGGIPQPDRVRIRAWAEVAASYLITDPRCVDALAPYYVWTTDYPGKRPAWKRALPPHRVRPP